MGIFGKKKNKEPQVDLINELGEPQEVPATYETTIEYLTGLSDEEYERVQKVASIYRKADKDACEALGKKYEPTTHIEPSTEEVPRDVNHTRPKTAEDLAMENEIEQAFLADDEPRKSKRGKNK